jgi:hypothetical protein
MKGDRVKTNNEESAVENREETLAIALDAYTDPMNPEYDPEFDREIRKAAPHWFS